MTTLTPDKDVLQVSCIVLYKIAIIVQDKRAAILAANIDDGVH